MWVGSFFSRLVFLNADFKMLKIILIALALHEYYWISD